MVMCVFLTFYNEALTKTRQSKFLILISLTQIFMLPSATTSETNYNEGKPTVFVTTSKRPDLKSAEYSMKNIICFSVIKRVKSTLYPVDACSPDNQYCGPSSVKDRVLGVTRLFPQSNCK
jgi:ATP/ADP translocase